MARVLFSRPAAPAECSCQRPLRQRSAAAVSCADSRADLFQVALIAVAAGAASAFVPNAPLALRSTRSAQASSISSAQMASVSVQGGPSKIPCEK
jgi:hypothetical protein